MVLVLDMALLELRNIVKRYGAIEVLKGVSLSIRRGEIVTVKGRSGVGKSTLCRIAALLSVPDSGEAVFQGIEVGSLSDYRRSKLRLRYIGYVDQQYSLIPTLRVIDNVELPLRLLGVPKSVSRKRAEEILQKLGLGGKEERFPTQLSAGEQQRVAIARALVKEPQLLVMDEPLSCLDDETSATVVELLREYVSSYRCGLLLTTTDLGFSLGYRAYILRDGKLVEV